MALYRKRPVLREAEQWWPDKALASVSYEGERPYVVTAHGQRAYLAPGDWVITEPGGVGHYPCKPDIFEAEYEAVD